MIQDVAFRRKVLYLAIMALLMIPLYMIGHPAAGDPTLQESLPGGKLSQLRNEYTLSQAQLGEIDPASESMKLATLGMRGVAANILWTKANQYKKTENWEKMVAVVNQMAKLQPNYITVWEFQSHNLSYNISVEHDDYRFRYQWVKKGIDFLIQGTKYNRKEPRLFWTVGWYTGQKFGRADESKQFRRLFRKDNDFHDGLNDYVVVDSARCDFTGQPDNWLVARLWFNSGYDIVKTMGVPIRGKSPHIFYADGPKSRMNYSVAIEAEGHLGEKAAYSWEQAGDEWDAYGELQVPTSQGLIISLNDEESMIKLADRLNAELDELAPNVRDNLTQDKLNALTDAEREAFQTPMSEIKEPEIYDLHFTAADKMFVSPRDVANNAPKDVRARANKLTDRIAAAQENAVWIDKYRGNVNFEYWRTRCKVEQNLDTVRARKFIYDAGQDRDKVLVEQAREKYEKAWDIWAGILDENPNLMQELMADDLLEDVQAYMQLLGHLEEKLPADFKLLPLLELHESVPEDMLETAAPKATPGEPTATDDGDDKKSAATPPAEGDPAAKDDAKTPAADDPAATTPDADKPDTTGKPAADKPDAAKPETTDQPAADKPATEKPATEKSNAEDAPSEKAEEAPAADQPSNEAAPGE